MKVFSGGSAMWRRWRIYVGVCAGSCSVDRPRERWIDTVKDFLREIGLDVRQARRMAGVCEEECTGRSPLNEPLTLTRRHSCGLPKLYETIGRKSVCGRAYNLKGIKGKISFPFFA